MASAQLPAVHLRSFSTVCLCSLFRSQRQPCFKCLCLGRLCLAIATEPAGSHGMRCSMSTTSPQAAVVTLLQVLVAQKVTTGVYKGVTTAELDELAAETAASMTATHPDYALVHTFHRPCACNLPLSRISSLSQFSGAGGSCKPMQTVMYPGKAHADVVRIMSAAI